MDYILCQMFKVIWRTLPKNQKVTDNAPIKKYVNIIETTITFKIKRGYYLDVLTSETAKLLGSTKSKITENENNENLYYLKITEIVLVLCNVVNNDYQRDSKVSYTFVPKVIWSNYFIAHLNLLYF